MNGLTRFKATMPEEAILEILLTRLDHLRLSSIIRPSDLEESTLNFVVFDMCPDGKVSLGLRLLTRANYHKFGFGYFKA